MPTDQSKAPQSRHLRITGENCSVLSVHQHPDPTSKMLVRWSVSDPRVAADVVKWMRYQGGGWPILWRPGKPPVMAVGVLQDLAREQPPEWRAACRTSLERARSKASPVWQAEIRRGLAALDVATSPQRDSTPALLHDVAIERCEQMLRFGTRTIPVFTDTNGIHADSVTATQHQCDAAAAGHRVTVFDILHEEYQEAREHGITDAARAAELIQVAAVAVSAAEMLLRPAPEMECAATPVKMVGHRRPTGTGTS